MAKLFSKTIVIMCALFVCAGMALADTETVDGVKYSYTITDGKAYMTNASIVTNYDIKVPETLGGCPVVSVGGFDEDVKSVVLPDTVEVLKESAFNWCDEMRTVTLSQNLKRISARAFTNCRELRSINIPASVTAIDKYAFNYCQLLESISLSENITSIGEGAFYACKSIESINFPNGLRSIGKGAFFLCMKLETVIIPKTVRTISDFAFAESVRDDLGMAKNYLRARTYSNICYTGSAEEWGKISIGNYNTNLTNSAINYNVPTCYVKISNAENGTKVTVTPENMNGAVVLVGAYEDKKMTFIQKCGEEEDAVVIPDTVDFKSIKVFVFDSIDSIMPIYKPIIREFNLK